MPALALAGRGGRHSHSDGDRRRAALSVVAAIVFAAAAPVFAQTPPPSPLTPPSSPSPLIPPPPSAQELARAQALVRANALELAQEILQSRAPALRPSPAWLAWERQLWVVYRLRGRWNELHARAAPALKGARWPAGVSREARLQAVKALVELQRGAEARRLIDEVLADADAPAAHHRQARRARVASFLADGLATEARRALRDFQARYGLQARPADADLQLMTAAAALQAGDAAAAVSELATVDSPPAGLLKLYARLVSRELPPADVAAAARALLESPGAPARSIHAVIAAAHRQAGAQYPLADALEAYLLTPADSEIAGVETRFDAGDLLEAYAAIAAHQIARAGLLPGDRRAHLAFARGLPPALNVARKALFAQLAATVDTAEIRQAAVDGYINEIINSERITLIPLLFDGDDGGGGGPLGNLSLGGRTALRLSAAAVAAGDFALAATANAAMREFPPDAPAAERRRWLLRAGRVDLLAGHPARGAAKLDAYLESFVALDARQTDAVLQPIFDLQTIGEHALALELLRKVDALAPRGKHMREIAFWRAESYAGDGKPRLAAAAFLHSAMAGEDSFDRWGRAARALAAEALLDAGLFADARHLLQDLLAGAPTDAGRLRLRQQLQRARLLEANSARPGGPADSPPAE